MLTRSGWEYRPAATLLALFALWAIRRHQKQLSVSVSSLFLVLQSNPYESDDRVKYSKRFFSAVTCFLSHCSEMAVTPNGRSYDVLDAQS